MRSSTIVSPRHGFGLAGLVLLVAACSSIGSTSPRPATGAPEARGSSLAPELGSTPSPAAGATSGAPSRVVPSTDLGDRLVATIDGVERPCAMAFAERDVWVTGNSPSMLARIDPGTNRIVSQSPMDGSPCGIAVGPDGRLWAALLSVGRVVAIDPATGDVAATIDDLGSQLWDLKAGFGAIWVVDRSNRELLRIDPRSAAVSARIAIGPSGGGLAITGTAVWVADDVDGIVRRIDPGTNTVSATSEVGRGSTWFANDDRTLVVANRLDGSIIPIDPTDAGTGDPIEGLRNPLDGTVREGRAYIPDGKARTLVEVDLATGVIGLVDGLADARMPFVAEIGFGDLWVLDYGGRRIWRIMP